jgi:hypothetical protein
MELIPFVQDIGYGGSLIAGDIVLFAAHYAGALRHNTARSVAERNLAQNQLHPYPTPTLESDFMLPLAEAPPRIQTSIHFGTKRQQPRRR